MMAPSRPRYSRISKEVEALLDNAGVLSAPVPVKEIAELRGATVIFENFDNEISGLLLRQNGRIIIGVAGEQSPNRQRFTIAHELGHLVLHDVTVVHVDRNFAVLFRSSLSSTAQDVLEIEANAFAAELLMPEALIRNDTKGLLLDVEDDVQISDLAARSGVSAQAMTYRLLNLVSRNRLTK